MGCSSAHRSAALGRLISTRGLVFSLQPKICRLRPAEASPCKAAAPRRAYLSAIDRIRAAAPPHACRQNLDRRQWGVSFDKKDPIGGSAHGAKRPLARKQHHVFLAQKSSVSVRVMPTDENLIIVRRTLRQPTPIGAFVSSLAGLPARRQSHRTFLVRPLSPPHLPAPVFHSSAGTLGMCRQWNPARLAARRPPVSEQRRTADPVARLRGARSRACGSARSCIQPCSSHSRIAPASCSTEIAQPRSVRVAARRFFVISIKKDPARDESLTPVYRSGC